MKKRIFSLLLALTLCLGLLPTSAVAADSDFIIENGVLIYYKGSGGDVVIPNGVTTIGEGAFGSHGKNVKSITIPDSVVAIKRDAFFGCANLERVTIPNGLVYIGSSAFYGCSSLNQVTIPASVRYIDSAAFYDCVSLSQITLPDSAAFSGNAFYGTALPEEEYVGQGISISENGKTKDGYWITDDGRLYYYDGPGGAIRIPDGVSSIRSLRTSSRTERSDITSIEIPSSVQTIESDAFRGCSALKTLTIPDSVIVVEVGAFAGCTALEDLTIGNGVVFLNNGTFGGVTHTSLYPDPATGKLIEKKTAYEGCTTLKKVTFPAADKIVPSLKLIDIYDVFGNCPTLEEIVNCPTPAVYDRMAANQAITAAWSGIDPNTCITPQSERIVTMSNQICAGLTSNYEKSKAIFDWLTANIDYDYDYYEGRKSTVTYYPEEVLDSKLTVCDGYSRLNQALLHAQRIPSLRITGLAYGGITDAGNGHAWNMAFVDGRWIYIDATWGRPSTSRGGGKVEYSYNPNWFDPTILNLSLNHQGERSFTNPSKVYYVGQNDTPSKFAATPNRSAVLVNGQTAAFDAYTINQNNYFKLRDLAKVLNGTGKQFEVTWDGSKNAINLVSDKAYTVVGGEMAAGDGTNKDAALNTSAIYLNSQPIPLTAYTINGNNYFKLRDIGKLFNFGVAWDGANNAIVVDTAKAYTED